jgi:hypothetical protein
MKKFLGKTVEITWYAREPHFGSYRVVSVKPVKGRVGRVTVKLCAANAEEFTADSNEIQSIRAV